MTAPGLWNVVIPVKAAERGKTRLSVEHVDRAGFVRAVALDTIAAAAACDAVARVFVVTSDVEVAAGARMLGATIVDEGSARGLDAAVATGVTAAGDRMPRAALLGDLPALRPDDLAVALRAAALHARGVVADADGTGSTLVTAAAGVPWSSAFGADSHARHRALGCVALQIPDASTLRHDVDTAEQLAAAVDLGLGTRTAGLLDVVGRR